MSHTRPRHVPQMSRSHLEVKGQNEYYLIELYLVRPAFQPCIIGFQRNLAQMFTRPVPERSRSHLEVKGQNEYCLIGLPCPVRISTMRLRILKLLDTHVRHDEVACTSKVKVTPRGQSVKGQKSTV